MNTAQKYLSHLRTITLHKWYVGVECFKRGLYWQGIIHDLSKYSWAEFGASAKYFQGVSTPIGEEKRQNGYSKAWLHHKGHNPHHWEYWIDWVEGETLLCPIPEKYITEMACDMIGASKAYMGSKHTPDSPLKYFQLNQATMLMRIDDKSKLHELLKEYAQCTK
jgi:hypothetical protein